MAVTLGELAARVGATLWGDPEVAVDTVAPLEDARPGAVAYLGDPRQRGHLAATRASAVILAERDRAHSPVPVLVCHNPHATFARVAALLYPPEPIEPGVHPTALVAEDAQVDPAAALGAHCVVESGARIAAGTRVGPGCLVGRGAVVGEDARLVARVSVMARCRLGRRVVVHPGTVIGSDGFGFAYDDGVWIKVPQLGAVAIGDDVEIGANTTIDRGALRDTVIEDGVKIDNQVQIAHNVHVGRGTIIAGCAGIAGSARIGSGCAIGGGVGIAGHLEVADGVQITGMSFVSRSIREAGTYSSGTPIEPNARWRRNFVRMTRLEEIWQRLQALERRVHGTPREDDKGPDSE